MLNYIKVGFMVTFYLFIDVQIFESRFYGNFYLLIDVTLLKTRCYCYFFYLFIDVTIL